MAHETRRLRWSPGASLRKKPEFTNGRSHSQDPSERSHGRDQSGKFPHRIRAKLWLGAMLVRHATWVVAAIGTLAMVSPAHAATFGISGTTIVYQAAPGEVNEPQVGLDAGGAYVGLRGGTGVLTAGPGCAPLVDSGLIGCPTDGITTVIVRLGDGNDEVLKPGGPLMPLSYGYRVEGGPGNDDIEGTTRNDLLIGGSGRDGIGGAGGTDKLKGGAGDDRLYGQGTLEGQAGDDSSGWRSRASGFAARCSAGAATTA